MSETHVLEMRGITKRFPGVLALDSVDFDLRTGEVHALVGENGAGKSTLMKILSGALRADAGQILIDGQPVSINSPQDAARLGIAMIYQELNLAPHLSAGENIFLGREPLTPAGLVDFRRLHEQAQRLLDEVGAQVSSRQRVCELGIGQQQMVEIAKALCQNARFIIMDEPTASLSEAEVERLFRLIRDLKSRGVGIAYISHRLEEIFEIADRVTVLRDGQRVASKPVSETDIHELVRLMVGREVELVYPRRAAKVGDEVLRVENLSRPPDLFDISFSVRAGEIVGLAGLVGAGRTELARAIFGADPPTAGTIYVDGRPVIIRSPQDAIRAGIALLTEDRKRDGLCLGLPVRANISLANLGQVMQAGLLSFTRERALAEGMVKRLDIRVASVDQLARYLSGGNQQKVVLAKWLLTRARVFIFDEPTQGIDVGAKAEIYRLIERLAQDGGAIIFISSYLPELMAMSDRILVMSRGRIVGELSREEATQEKILELAAIGR